MSTRKTALISVSDKAGVVDLGQALIAHGWRILSTGGTARCLSEAGIPVTEVSDHTGFPEIMGGRVKTLQPRIHGGILARRDQDESVMREHGIETIDLVVVNLYPFSATVARSDCSLDEAIEQIDVGGPAMLRAAAKNHAHVTVLVDPADYRAFIDSLPDGPDLPARRALATKGFSHSARYDAQISQYLARQHDPEGLPPLLNLMLERQQPLRYGENPHQDAAVYRSPDAPPAGLAGTRPLQGKALSYNNLLDADAAWTAVQRLGQTPACVIVKHSNPCGAAIGEDIGQAWSRALACDPTSAFGGIVAFNQPLDAATAEALAERFLEVIIAPAISDGAREHLAGRKNLRVLIPSPGQPHSLEIKAIDGGWLVQQPDPGGPANQLKVVTERHPEADESSDLALAWAVVQSVRSNAIVYVKAGATVGIGAGQMSRVDSARIGAIKAGQAGLSLDGAVMASDAFFPFADSIESAAEQGIRAVIQPGGSMRDQEVIEACDRHGIAMVLTGRRHFRH